MWASASDLFSGEPAADQPGAHHGSIFASWLPLQVVHAVFPMSVPRALSGNREREPLSWAGCDVRPTPRRVGIAGVGCTGPAAERAGCVERRLREVASSANAVGGVESARPPASAGAQQTDAQWPLAIARAEHEHGSTFATVRLSFPTGLGPRGEHTARIFVRTCTIVAERIA